MHRTFSVCHHPFLLFFFFFFLLTHQHVCSVDGISHFIVPAYSENARQNLIKSNCPSLNLNKAVKLNPEHISFSIDFMGSVTQVGEPQYCIIFKGFDLLDWIQVFTVDNNVFEIYSHHLTHSETCSSGQKVPEDEGINSPRVFCQCESRLSFLYNWIGNIRSDGFCLS